MKYIFTIAIIIFCARTEPAYSQGSRIRYAYSVVDQYNMYVTCYHDSFSCELGAGSLSYWRPQEGIIYFVRSYAVWENIILGTTEMDEDFRRYFILDTSLDDARFSRPEYFDERSEWLGAMEKYSIPQDIELLNPVDIAKSLPRQESQAWKYQYTKNFMGLSDDTWCGILFMVIVAMCFVIGLSKISKSYLTRITILTGIVYSIMLYFVGRGYLYGDAPCCTAEIGPLVILTFICWLSGITGKYIRKKWKQGRVALAQPKEIVG
jgi:hypothetical protein